MGVSASGTTGKKRIWKNLGGASAPLASPLDPPIYLVHEKPQCALDFGLQLSCCRTYVQLSRSLGIDIVKH